MISLMISTFSATGAMAVQEVEAVYNGSNDFSVTCNYEVYDGHSWKSDGKSPACGPTYWPSKSHTFDECADECTRREDCDAFHFRDTGAKSNCYMMQHCDFEDYSVEEHLKPSTSFTAYRKKENSCEGYTTTTSTTTGIVCYDEHPEMKLKEEEEGGYCLYEYKFNYSYADKEFCEARCSEMYSKNPTDLQSQCYSWQVDQEETKCSVHIMASCDEENLPVSFEGVDAVPKTDALKFDSDWNAYFRVACPDASSDSTVEKEVKPADRPTTDESTVEKEVKPADRPTTDESTVTTEVEDEDETTKAKRSCCLIAQEKLADLKNKKDVLTSMLNELKER